MAATYRLKGIGWFAGCVAVTLSFYLVSLQVAAERKRLEVITARIATAQRDIRSLETEFDTRANLAQLERWNGDTLALAAPRATQFVTDEAQLAAIDARRPLADPTGPQVKTAALVVPTGVAPTAPVPVQVPVAPVAAAPVAVASLKAPVAPASVRHGLEKVALARAALTRVAVTPIVARAVATIRPAVALRARPEIAMLDRKLLSDATLGDLVARARSERGGRR